MSRSLLAVTALAAACALAKAGESLPPLPGGKPPQDLDAMWGDYDPTAEPIQARVVRRWRDGPVRLRVVTYTVGTFKGRKSTMAAFYAVGAGRGGKKRLPGVLHCHGGGQRASRAVVTFLALNGYAAMSINWGARPMEGAPAGEANTDWGAVDPTQTGHNSHYASMAPDEKTVDAVESPRNNNWFLLVLAARRAITFLQQQDEVDPERIGVMGHSMGGKLTVDTAGIDKRVTVAAPSCGGAGAAPEAVRGRPGAGLRSKPPRYLATIDNRAYLPGMTCPILYCGPTNDFNAPVDCLFANWRAIGSEALRFAVSPHRNHRHQPEFAICRYLWLDRHLRGGRALPATPELTVQPDTPTGVPLATVRPDRPGDVAAVNVYYAVDPHVITRFWRGTKARRTGDAWSAPCPVPGADRPLFVLANVLYPLEHTYAKHRWLDFDDVDGFGLTSRLRSLTPAELGAAGVKATGKPGRMIDDFSRPWHDWYRLNWNNPVHWSATTRKLKDPTWRGGPDDTLLLDVRSPQDNLLAFRVDVGQWGAYPKVRPASYYAVKRIPAGEGWQTVAVARDDLRPREGDPPATMPSWEFVTELTLAGRVVVERGDRREVVEGLWRRPRAFRRLRWARQSRRGVALSPSGR